MHFATPVMRNLLLTGVLAAVPAITVAAPEFTPEQAAWISVHPVVRVASDLASPPWDYLAPDQHPAGLVPDFLAAIAAQSGLKFEFLPPQRRKQLEQLLSAQKADLVVAYGLAATANSASLPVRRALLLDQPVRVERAIALPPDQQAPEAEVNLADYSPGVVPPGSAKPGIYAAGFEAALIEVADGRARSATLPLLLAGYLIRERGLTQLSLRSAEAAPTDLRWRVGADAAPLREILELSWDQIPPAQQQQIKARWIMPLPMSLPAPPAAPPVPQGFLTAVGPNTLLIGVGAIMATLLLLAWAQRVLVRRGLRKTWADGKSRQAEVLEDVLYETPAPLFVMEKTSGDQWQLTQVSHDALKLFDVDANINRPSGEVFFRTIEPADHAGLSEALRLAETELRDVDHSYRVHTKSGLRWIATAFRPRRMAGGSVRILGASRDITERVQLQSQLEAERQTLDELTATTPGVIYRFSVGPDGRSRMLYVAPSLGDLRGLKREEVLADGEAMYANMHEEDRERVRDTVKRAARAFVPYETEYRVRMPDGSMAWIHGSATPSSGADGNVIFSGFSHNITVQRRIEQQLRDAESFLRELTDAVPGFLFQLTQSADGGTRRFTFLSAGAALHGVTPQEAMADARNFYEAVLPDDRKLIRDTVEHSAQTLTPYRMDYRVRLKSGALTWMRSQAVPRRMPTGELVWNGLTTYISEEKFRQLEAQRAEARLKAFAMASPGVIFERVVAEGGEVIYPYVGGGIADLLQLAPEDWMRDGEAFEGLLLAEDRKRFVAACNDAARDGGVISVDCRAKRPDARIIWLRAYLRRSDDESQRQCVNGQVIDVTDEREAQIRVAVLERRMQELTADAPCVLFQLLCNGERGYQFTFVSAAILQMAGYSREAVQRDSTLLLDCIAAPERERIFAILQAAAAEQRACILDFTLTSAHRASKRIRASFSAPRAKAGTQLWSGVWQELTGISENQVSAAAKTADVASAERLKSEFLANISHEIRTPLNAILGMGQLVQKTTLNPRQQGYLGKMLGAAESLMGILNDVLDFSRVEAGHLALEPRKFDLNTLLDRLSDQLGARAAEKNLELVFDLSRSVPNLLIGDARRLGQVLFNLVSNAIKFSDKGVVLVRIRMLEQTAENIQLNFAVSDEGIGINEAQKQNLFEPFSQGDASTTRKYGGTGLGLALSRTLVKLMGGAIQVDSTPGAGSTFFFTANFGYCEGDAISPLPEGLQGLKVLYCGGHPLTREIALARLSEAGLQAQGAAGLSQLMSSLAADTGEPIQLLMLDEPQAVLPDAARILRNNPQTAHMALIMLTPAGAEAERGEESRGPEQALTLKKPASPAQMINAVLIALGHVAVAARSQHLVAEEADDGCLPPQSTRILVVDDDDLNQHIIMEWLQDSACTVRLASNGVRALETLALTAFDLVLMDVDMPVMDGLSATESLRAEPGFASLPVIAMTSSNDAEERQRCLAAGCNEVLLKPLDRRELMAAMHKCLPAEARTETGQEAARAQPSLPLLDTTAALTHMNGALSLYHRLLARFLSEYRSLDADIAEAHAGKNRETALRMVHTLKGMAGSLGARSLEHAAAETETALHEDQGVEAALARLHLVHGQTLHAIEALISTQPATAPIAPVPPGAIEELGRLLKEQDADAKDAFAALQPSLQAQHPVQLSRLAAALENYDFDTALAALQAILLERSLVSSDRECQ